MEEINIDDERLLKLDKKKNNTNKLVKFFKGIKIYFKDYILFLKGGTIKILHLMRYTTYHWGFQMIVIYGVIQSISQINNMAIELSPYLVKGGEIE
jgi:hypothetical protein